MGGRSNARGTRQTVTKAELGTKRVCPNCGTRYYDLNRNPIICPHCGTKFEVAPARRAAAPAPKAVVPEPEVEIEKDEVETVSLEEADEEATEGGQVKVEPVDDEDDVDDDKEGDDDTFLAEEDDEDEDVDDIIGDVDEEEP
jgi:uncharacterized protein (TIGR02300 family)